MEWTEWLRRRFLHFFVPMTLEGVIFQVVTNNFSLQLWAEMVVVYIEVSISIYCICLVGMFSSSVPIVSKGTPYYDA
jgi:hypothetical protein